MNNVKMEQLTEFQDTFSEEVWRLTYKDHKDNNINNSFRRTAKAIASVEKTEELRNLWEDNFYDLLTDFKAVTGGRILSNAGTEWSGTTLANCFVSPNPEYDIDSLEGILQVLTFQSKTLKSEGGYGANFSFIRPRGAFIHGIGVETPGAVKYMELFDKSSEIITEGSGIKSKNKKAKGKIRKGAQMGVIDCWHPDVLEFITAKQTPGRLSKFNLSVNCSNEFMDKVEQVRNLKDVSSTQDKIDAITWDLVFPETTFEKYKGEWDGNFQKWKSKGYPVKVYQTVTVDFLWNLITKSTYNRNEPGVLFLDRANELNEANYIEHISCTNPCGEQTLAPAGICTLSTLNLTQFVDEKKQCFDLEKIKKYSKYLVRFLDNVNEYSDAPLPQYVYSMRNKRRIGGGLMGWGSALYMLKKRFGSDESEKLQTELMKAFTYSAVEASIDLAEEKGMFSLCDPEKHAKSKFWKQIDLPKHLIERMKKHGIRNSSLFSFQPNGNTSILANVVTGGLEPVFMPEYIRTVIVSTMPEHIAGVTPKWYEGEFFETSMFKFSNEGDDKILKGIDSDGTVYKIDKNRGLTKEVHCQDYGVRYLSKKGEWDKDAHWAVTTENLSVDEHVRDMKGFAKFVDSAVSKTVNLPNDYSFDKFQNLYLDAYKTGYIKGITTYRSGTMTSVLSSKETPEDEETILADVKLPESSDAFMKVLRAENRKWYLTVVLNEMNKEPMALFVHTNSQEKSISTTNATEKLLNLASTKGIPEKHIEAVRAKFQYDSNSTKIARAISLLLRHGVKIKNIVSELDKMNDVSFGTFLFQIKKFLSSYIKDGEKVDGTACSNCSSSKIIYSEGCMKCVDCGSSKCS
jgi:ribonucleoside-diphosphate reductase alpha chain